MAKEIKKAALPNDDKAAFYFNKNKNVYGVFWNESLQKFLLITKIIEMIHTPKPISPVMLNEKPKPIKPIRSNTKPANFI